jgi:hypothetical protein
MVIDLGIVGVGGFIRCGRVGVGAVVVGTRVEVSM